MNDMRVELKMEGVVSGRKCIIEITRTGRTVIGTGRVDVHIDGKLVMSGDRQFIEESYKKFIHDYVVEALLRIVGE